jgi:hypothetical protein
MNPSIDKKNRTKLVMAAGLLLLVSVLSVAALVGSDQLGGSASSVSSVAGGCPNG